MVESTSRALRRFYEPLVLLFALDPTRGSQMARPNVERLDSGHLSRRDQQRDFLNSLSYLCDYDAGGDTVTAILPQQRCGGVTYLVATNERTKHRVCSFLDTVLRDLHDLYGMNLDAMITLGRSILLRSVAFGQSRLIGYMKQLKKPLDYVLTSMESKSLERKGGVPPEHLEALVLLEKFLHKAINTALVTSSRSPDRTDELLELCILCYQTRKGLVMEYLRDQALEVEASRTSHNEFSEVRHFIGRLGMHIRAVKALVSMSLTQPQLFVNSRVQKVPCPSAGAPPPLPHKTSLEGIANRMSSGVSNLERLQSGLMELNRHFDLEDEVHRLYQNMTIPPRIHAEVILLDYAWRHEVVFVDNDRYIGCSKPACYCCWLYFRNHPGRFVEPASHKKIYLNWAMPDANAGHVKTMVNKMVPTIRDEACEQVISRRPQQKFHHDSVTGGTPTVLGVEKDQREAMSRVDEEDELPATAPPDHDLENLLESLEIRSDAATDHSTSEAEAWHHDYWNSDYPS